MTSATCPGEEGLLPLAVGDPVEESVRRHAATCPDCQALLRRLQTEVASLRELDAGQSTIPAGGPAAPPRRRAPPLSASISSSAASARAARPSSSAGSTRR
jgi:hypothetical protein